MGGLCVRSVWEVSVGGPWIGPQSSSLRDPCGRCVGPVKVSV